MIPGPSLLPFGLILGINNLLYYNVFTVEGTAASRVFFRIVA